MRPNPETGSATEVSAPSLPLALLLLASTSIVVGTLWDISWDASFGRDSFWSAPHIAFNFGVIFATIAAAWMAIAARGAALPAAFQIGTLRLPLGAAVVIWGGAAVFAASVLELWWSNAYGLGTSSWPPHQFLLVLAILVLLGGTLLCAAWRDNNRAATPTRSGRGASPFGASLPTSGEWAAGLLLTFAATAASEHSLPNLQRTAFFYQVSTLAYPCLLLGAAAVGGRPWSATRAALVYTGILCLLVWILPLFPARPLIGPVYQQIDSMLPPRFPLLLLGPAVAIDLILRRVRRGDWWRSSLCGVAFVAVFMALQWSFSAFLLAPASDNWLFAGGGGHWPFYLQMGSEGSLFWGGKESPVDFASVTTCVAAAVLSARLGLWLGNWARQVRR